MAVPVWITAKTASLMTGLSPRMLSKMADDGRFHVLRVGDGWRRYSLDEIEEFVRSNCPATLGQKLDYMLSRIDDALDILTASEIRELKIQKDMATIYDTIKEIRQKYDGQ